MACSPLLIHATSKASSISDNPWERGKTKRWKELVILEVKGLNCENSKNLKNRGTRSKKYKPVRIISAGFLYYKLKGIV